ncbi:unnamed protein product [Moneuplotes crassus]|uniref:Lysosomal dipeptide transporter MFSD1 n=1 Tax=Euplotes crassus TaxID=5936 RepID=A0AAD1UGD7_EUPCR|nr:unnamed protein product [Moneuplotes crassus]
MEEVVISQGSSKSTGDIEHYDEHYDTYHDVSIDDTRKLGNDWEKKKLYYNTFDGDSSFSITPIKRDNYRADNRYYVLLLSTFLMFGGYFCMDQPNALSKHLEQSLTGESAMKYNMLYSVYAYPNIIMPFFGGVFIDKVGLKSALNILFALCIAGQAFFTFGGYIEGSHGYTMALFGRCLFGMGNESLNIVQSIFANKWFKGKELAFVLALGMSVGRLGSTSNNLLMPIMADKLCLSAALLFGLSLICICFCSGQILLRFEENAQRRELPVNNPGNDEKLDFSSLKKFPLSYWLICLSCVSVYSSIFPFTNISNSMFMHKYDLSLTVASRLTSSIFIIAALLCATFGFLIDRVGYRISFVVFSSFLLLTAHTSFLVMPACDGCYEGLFPLICIGIAYAIYAAALWPMIPIVIKEEYLGTAFGCAIAIQNAGCGFGPNIVGFLQNYDTSYRSTLIFFMLVSIFGILCEIVLYFTSKKYHSNKIQLPSDKIAEIESKEYEN